MNWKNRYLYAFLLLGIFTACDSFEDDVLPTGEEELMVKDAISVLPGTELFIDLKKAINASGAVKVQISIQPQQGTATIAEDAILQYKPKPEFLSGQDFLSLNLLSTQGAVVDTDSIFIQMVQSTDSLPCANGALTDYYHTPKNQTLYFDPSLNDGVCAGEISEVCITFTSQPEHGQLLDGDSAFTYKYIPETDFIGQDKFMYELKVVDHEGNADYSVAQIKIDVFEEVPMGCDSMVFPFHHVLEKPLEEFYIFQAFEPHPLCDVFEWDIDSLYATYGKAEVTEEGTIKYFPADGSGDHITYSISFGNKTFHNYITVEINGNDSGDCLEAVDDEYHLHIVGDSIGVSNEPHILDPVQNDRLCSDDFTIRILQEPTRGEAVVIDQSIQFYIEEDSFEGIVETTMLYELCDEGKCDSASIDLTLEKIN